MLAGNEHRETLVGGNDGREQAVNQLTTFGSVFVVCQQKETGERGRVNVCKRDAISIKYFARLTTPRSPAGFCNAFRKVTRTSPEA